MNSCENCIHEKVCYPWHDQERKGAGCFYHDVCKLFESVKPLEAQERAELQFYRSSGLASWQVSAMRESIAELKKILVGYENDRVNADIKCTDTIAYLNDELSRKLDYSDYSNLFDQISGITAWENEAYGGSDKQYMKKGGASDGVKT